MLVESEPRQPRKKALCIGVEYIELAKTYSDWRLHGTHQDTQILAELLQNVYGYQADDIRILTDAEDAPYQPTRDNIIEAMKELVRDACAGDHLLFHYSGHGSQVQAVVDLNEVDGYDEVIWPMDVKYNPPLYEEDDFTVENYIIDDDVRKILVGSLPPRVHLVVRPFRARLVMRRTTHGFEHPQIVLDCCSSGTGADLPFSSSASPLTSPVVGPRRNSISLCNPSVHPWSPFLTSRRCAARPRSQSVICAMPHIAQGVLQESVAIVSMPSNRWNDGGDQLPYVTSWSACLDNQQTLEDNSGGVFVKAFTEVLREFPRPTHAQLLKMLTRWLATHIRGDLWQSSKPQLGSIRDIRTICDTLFEL